MPGCYRWSYLNSGCLRFGVPEGLLLEPTLFILNKQPRVTKRHIILARFSSNVCRWHTGLQIEHTIWNYGRNQLQLQSEGLSTRNALNANTPNSPIYQGIFWTCWLTLPSLFRLAAYPMLLLLSVKEVLLTSSLAFPLNNFKQFNMLCIV